MNVMNRMAKRMANKQRKGFTLVELVVVILIIAILAAAIFLGGATVIKQARESQIKGDLNNMATYVQDMLYENPELQYFKGDASQVGAYGTQESYTFTTKDDAFYGDTNWDGNLDMTADFSDFTSLPVLKKLNDEYMTDDFQIGPATRDAWDAPYLWSFDMSPSEETGDPASCIIVINSLGVNSLDETSDACAADSTAIHVASSVIGVLGDDTHESATEVVETELWDATNKEWKTGDDYGVVIVMIDGQVSTAYYGF